MFHPYFIYIDQYLEIKPQTIQSVLVTAGFMMVISFIMIPNPICSLWVAFSIMSIVAGVLGYMTWWGVNLDGVALINLIMCIGFSVDYSAHICYHYMSVEDRSPDKKISASLYALGLPIIQGAISTILGVIGLAFAPSYLFITFFKMIFLVILPQFQIPQTKFISQSATRGFKESQRLFWVDFAIVSKLDLKGLDYGIA